MVVIVVIIVVVVFDRLARKEKNLFGQIGRKANIN